MMAKINEEKRSEWAALIQEQEASGLSRQAFCEKRGLHFSKFSYYQHVLRKQEHPKTMGVFSPVKIKNSFGKHEIQLLLPNGFQCTFPADLEMSRIKDLARTLLSC
jgi:hypothetical protein